MKKIFLFSIIIVLALVNFATATATVTDVKSKTDQYWTGWIFWGSKISGSGWVNEALWQKFDISSIPDGVDVTQLELVFTVTSFPGAGNDHLYSITPVSNDPVPASASTIIQDVNAEKNVGYYHQGNMTGLGTYSIVLGGTATTDFENSLANDWFAVGFAHRSGYNFEIEGGTSPTLKVTYTTVTPEMDVQRPAGTSIADGGMDDLVNTAVGTQNLTYTIDNSAGTDTLTIPSGGVTAANLSNSSGFSVATTLPLNVAAGGTATLDVSFDVDAEGAFSLDMDIASNDADENPYDIAIQGTGVNLTAGTSGPTSISNGGGSAILRGVQITNNSTNACDFTVTYNPTAPGGNPPDPGEMPMQWEITSDGNCGTLNVDLVFHYTDDELADGNSITEANLEVFKYAGSATWTNMGGTVDVAANTVSLAGVTSLSDWTIGDPIAGTPTAITLQSLSARATLANNLPVLVGALLGVMGVLLVLTRRKQNPPAVGSTPKTPISTPASPPASASQPEGDYTPPRITHELELETRAGSPLGGPVDPLDLLGK